MKKDCIDMKRAEEYLKQLFEEPFNLEEGGIEDDFLQIVKQIQIEAIKATVQACADNAEAAVNFIGFGKECQFDASEYEVYVIKSSILEVADKLIKELE